MKNTIYVSLVNFLKTTIFISWFLTFSLTGFLSCASIPNHVIETAFPRVDSKPPVDAFGLVLVQSTIKAKKCLETEKIDICEEVIKNLPPISQGGIGSGLLVKSKTKSVFLTAAHVCSSQTPDLYETEGIAISLETYTQIKIRIDTGEELDAKIIKIEEDSDLCALLPSRQFTRPVQWSSKEPEVGDFVYALSAPHGINAPSMTLIFSGYYSGDIGEMSHYSIPTRPGSSGSIVLDKNFMGVGMLNAAYIKVESIGMGTSYERITKFLDSI